MRTGSTYKRLWIFALLSTAAIICFCIAIYQSQRFATLSECVSVRYKQPSLTIEAMQQALENEKEHAGNVKDATLWSETKESILTEQQHKASLRTLLVFGDPVRAYPADCLYGAYPAMGDPIGCAVDQKAADALFGGENVIGNTLLYKEKPYIVRGVFEGMEGVVIVQADNRDKSKFSALSLAVLPGVNGRETAQSFLLSNGLAMPDAVIDAPFLVQFVKALGLLPAWVISFVLIARMVFLTIRLRTSPLLFLAAAVVTIGVTVLMLYASEGLLAIPDRLIPTKWSDFSFWTRLIEQARSHIAQARSVESLLMDDMRNHATLRCGIFSCIAAVLFISAIAIKAVFNLRQYIIIELWIITATFLTLLALSALGKAMEAPRALWLTWMLYIGIANVLNQAFPGGGSRQGEALPHPLLP